jgi:hypothetical protein
MNIDGRRVGEVLAVIHGDADGKKRECAVKQRRRRWTSVENRGKQGSGGISRKLRRRGVKL